MGDYKNLPAWKRGMAFAHGVYALVDAAGLKETESGRRVRKAAVSVPSLIAEACLVLTSRDPQESLFTADARLAEVARLLGEEPLTSALPEGDRLAVLDEIEGLRAELAETYSSDGAAAH